MKTIHLFSFLLLLTLINACDDDEQILAHFEVDRFVGNYEVTAQHITGLHPVYDDMGTFLGYDKDTLDVTHSLLIEKIDNDSVALNGLLNFWSHDLSATKAIVIDDTLQIQHEFSSNIQNDYIRGKLWLSDNQLHLDYRWDKSDIWSTDATPEYGVVLATGTEN